MDYRELVFYQKARQVTPAAMMNLEPGQKRCKRKKISRQVFRTAASGGAKHRRRPWKTHRAGIYFFFPDHCTRLNQ